MSSLPLPSLWQPGQLWVGSTASATVSHQCRIFSEGEFSTAKKRLRSTPVPIDPATCPSCGPYRLQHPIDSSASSSRSNGGYIKGISPSPSELALPNVAFSTEQLNQLDILTFEVRSDGFTSCLN